MSFNFPRRRRNSARCTWGRNGEPYYFEGEPGSLTRVSKARGELTKPWYAPECGYEVGPDYLLVGDELQYDLSAYKRSLEDHILSKSCPFGLCFNDICSGCTKNEINELKMQMMKELYDNRNIEEISKIIGKYKSKFEELGSKSATVKDTTTSSSEA